MTDRQEWATPAEISVRYSVPIATLKEWRETGYGPKATRLGRRSLRYKIADWEAFLALRSLQALRLLWCASRYRLTHMPRC